MLAKTRFPLYIRAMAIVMLFAMFHYMLGYRFVYSLGILYAKDEAKECMVKKNSNSQKLALSTAEYNSLKWTEKGKEFSFDNEMYDIISIQKTNEGYVVTVYSDKTETGWVASLHNYEKELFQPDQTAKGTKSAQEIMSSFQKDCTPGSEFTINIFASKGLNKPIIVCLGGHPLQVYKSIWHPPAVC